MTLSMPVTFVTGASSGIGRSLARRIADEGHAVAAVARRRDLLESLVAEIEQSGGKAMAIACDVTDRERVFEAVGVAESALGPITRLVANAGGGERTLIDGFSAEQVARTLALNVGGTAVCIEAVLPGMLARGNGHIVAVGSLAAYRGLPGAAAYSAAKAALANMMESLRIDLGPRGIQVTLLLPGFVRSKLKRKKKRPFELELEDATARMHQAIIAERRQYAFPWPLVLAVNVGRMLPARLYDRLLVGRDRKRKDGLD